MSIYRNKFQNSKTIFSVYDYYCVYCGKKAITDEEWDKYTRYSFQFCDCEKAKLEMECNRKMPRENHKIVENLKYKDELHELKQKYGKE